MKFSQRIGKTPATKTIQMEEIDTDLKNGLWNAIKLSIIDDLDKYDRFDHKTKYYKFCRLLWLHFYKLPIDTISESNENSEAYIRERYFQFKWFEVYDFLEYIANINPEALELQISVLKEFCNRTLERENSGYRFIDNNIAPITNSTEMKEIEDAINKSGHLTALSGANIHLKCSLDRISDKRNPDYRNSIKESISAVESVAKKISDNKKDTLGGALNEINKIKIKGKAIIHPALEEGFKQIYGYTSDAGGIRHGFF